MKLLKHLWLLLLIMPQTIPAAMDKLHIKNKYTVNEGIIRSHQVQVKTATCFYQNFPPNLPGVPKKYRQLINNRAKVFCSIVISFSVLNKPYPELNFEDKIVHIRSKLSEINYFKVDHSKWYKPSFGDLGAANSPITWHSFWMINYLSGECLGKFIRCLGALEWPRRS